MLNADGRTLSDYRIQKESTLQSLILVGKQLDSNCTLSDSNIQKKDGRTPLENIQKEYALHLVSRLRVGKQIFEKNVAYIINTLDVETANQLDNIKTSIFDKEGLTIAGKQLEHSHTLSDYHIQQEYAISLVLSLRGGMQRPMQTLADKTITSDASSISWVALDMTPRRYLCHLGVADASEPCAAGIGVGGVVGSSHQDQLESLQMREGLYSPFDAPPMWHHADLSEDYA